MFLLLARAARRLAESLSARTTQWQVIHAFGQLESQCAGDRIRFGKTQLELLAQRIAIAGTLPFQRMFTFDVAEKFRSQCRHRDKTIAAQSLNSCEEAKIGHTRDSRIKKLTHPFRQIGRNLIVNAALTRDLPVVQGVVFVMVLVVISINLAADLLYTVLDPRIR